MHLIVVKVKVTQSGPTLCNPMDYTVRGILQARILERVVFPFSRGSSQLRDRTQVSCIAVDSLPAEPQGKPSHCGSFSCCGAQALRHAGSAVATHQLSNTGPVVTVHRLSCHSMWGLPGPEIELMSPTFAGGFFATEPPGRP